MDEKLRKVYDLYLKKGFITEKVTFDLWSAANEDQQAKLYDLGKRGGLFKQAELEDFQTLWSGMATAEPKKKVESPGTSQEEVMESDIQVQQEDPSLSVSSGQEQVPDSLNTAPQFTGQFTPEQEDVTIRGLEEVPAFDFEAGRRRRGQQPKIEEAQRGQRGAKGTIEKDTGIERLFGKNEVTDFFGDIYRAGVKGFQTGQQVDEALELFGKGGSVTSEDVQDYINAVNAAGESDYVMSDEMADFNAAYEKAGGGLIGFLKGIAASPTVINEIAITSITQMVNPATLAAAGATTAGFTATGAAGGAAAGGVGAIPGAIAGAVSSIPFAIGAAGATLEAGLSFSEFLQEEISEKGLGFDEEGIRAVLNDPQAMMNIRAKSAGRGIAIGIIDRYTAGLAGKVSKGVIKKAVKGGKGKFATNVRALGAATPIEAAGGAIGEATARGIVGQEMDAAEIGFEAVGGGPGAIISGGKEIIFANKEGTYKMGPDKKAVSREEMINMITNTDDKTFAQSDLEISGDSSLKELAQDRKEKLRKKQEKQKQLGNNLDNLSEEQQQEALDLETELDELESENTRRAKNRKKEVEQRLDDLYSQKPEAAAGEDVDVSMDEVFDELGVDTSDPENIRGVSAEDIADTKKRLQEQKQKQNAIQESSTAQVDAQEQARDGETVGEGDAPGATTTEGEVQADITPTEETQVESADFGELIDQASSALSDVGQGVRGRNVTKTEIFDETVQENPDGTVEVASSIDEEGNTVMAPKRKGKVVSENFTIVDQTETDNYYNSDRFKRENNNIDKNQHEVNILNSASKAIAAISKVLPGLNIVAHRNENSYKDHVDVSSRGAYKSGTNTIHINIPKASGKTIAHEVFHAVLKAKLGTEVNIQDASKNMVDSVRKAIAQSETLTPDQIIEFEEYAAKFDSDVRNEEYLADIVGFLAENYTKLDAPEKSAVRQFIEKIASILGLDVDAFTQSDKDTVDLLNTIAEKVATGEEITETDLAALDQGGSINVGLPSTIQTTKTEKTDVNFSDTPPPLSFVTIKDKINIDALVKEISEKGQKVWFWVADQLGRGEYGDVVVGDTHYLDAGPSYALDPSNKKKGVVWASSMKKKALENNIANSDYVFLISGSPQRSKLFNRRVSQLLQRRVEQVGDFKQFKQELLDSKPVKAFREILAKYDSFEALINIDNSDRKEFLLAIEAESKKKNTPLKKTLEKFNAFLDFDSLRDGFYKENDFKMNDVMLVLKPSSVGEKSNHSTYTNDIMGEVVGVPDKKINAADIMTGAAREKLKEITRREQQSQVVAPYGSGVRQVQPASKKPIKTETFTKNQLLEKEVSRESLRSVIQSIRKSNPNSSAVDILTDVYKGNVIEDFNYDYLNDEELTYDALTDLLVSEEIFNNKRQAIDKMSTIGKGIVLKDVETTKKEPYTEKDVVETTDAKAFAKAQVSAIEKRKDDKLQVTLLTEQDAQKIIDDGGQLFMTEDGKAGAYVTKDGYMGGLFKDPTVNRSAAAKILQKVRIDAGGKFFDAFATYLEPLYIKNGFRPVVRMTFNEEFAPPGWKKTNLKSKPDNVFFVFDPDYKAKKGEGVRIEDYDKAYDTAKNFTPETKVKTEKFGPESNNKKLQNLGRMYNMNSQGFAPANVNLEALKQSAKKLGFGVKAAKLSYGPQAGKVTGYFFTKGGRKVNVMPGMTKTEVFDKGMSTQDIIKFGRDNNFSDAAIKDYLVRTKGLPVKEVTGLLSLDANLFSQMPPSFGNMKGGAKAGLKLFKKVLKFSSNLSKKLSPDQVVEQTLQFLEQQPEYIAEGNKTKTESQQQSEMIIEVQKSLDAKPNKDTSKRVNLLKEAVRNRKKGAKELSAVKRKLRNFIRQALPKDFYTKKDVMSLINKVTKADATNIDNLTNEVIEMVTKKQNENLEAKIDSILNGKYQSVEAGRQKGKGVDNQTRLRLEAIKEAISDKAMVADDVVEDNVKMNNEINDLMAKTEQTPDDRNRIMDLMVIININNAKLNENTDVFKTESLSRAENLLLEIVGEGKENFKAQLAEDHKRYIDQQNAMYKAITGKDIDLSDPESVNEKVQEDIADKRLKEKVNKGFKKAMSSVGNVVGWFGKSHESLSGLMDILQKTPGQIFDGPTTKDLVYRPVNKATRAFKEKQLSNAKVQVDKMKDIFGKKWKKAAHKNATLKPTGVFRDQAAVDKAQAEYDANPTRANRRKLSKVKKKQELELSDNQVGYLHNQYKDPANLPSFANPYNEYFGPDHERIMTELRNQVDPKVLEYADWMVDEYYPSLYDGYNAAYEQIYRTSMPWNQYYGGRIFRVGVDPEPLNLIGDKAKNINATDVGSPSTKVRVNSKDPIKPMDMLDSMTTYTTDMDWFSSMGPTLRDINKIFTNKEIRKSIEANHGRSILTFIDFNLKQLAARGINTAGAASFINQINNLFISTRLGANPTIMLKQLTSFIAYADRIGPINYAKYAAKNKAEFLKIFKEIRDNSVYVQDRMGGDIKKNLESYSGQTIVGFEADAGLSFFNKIMMGFVKAGDIGAIYLGGMPAYSYYKAEFKKNNPDATEQQAIDYAIEKFEEDTKETQQSKDIQDKDWWQQQGPIVRSLQMFVSAPRQMVRQEFAGLRMMNKSFKQKNAKDGVKLFGKGFRKFATFHMVLPMFFQYVALGLPGLMKPIDDEDEEDLLRAAILGSFNSLFALGDVLNVVADYAQEKPWAGATRDLAPLSLVKELTDLQKRASNTKDEEKKAELTRRLYSRAAEIGLKLTTKQSVPIYNLTKWAKNVDELSKGEDPGKAFLRLFNYSEYQISGGPKGKKVKTLKRGEGGGRGSSDRGAGGNRGKSNRGAGGNRGE